LNALEPNKVRSPARSASDVPGNCRPYLTAGLKDAERVLKENDRARRFAPGKPKICRKYSHSQLRLPALDLRRYCQCRSYDFKQAMFFTGTYAAEPRGLSSSSFEDKAAHFNAKSRYRRSLRMQIKAPSSSQKKWKACFPVRAVPSLHPSNPAVLAASGA